MRRISSTVCDRGPGTVATALAVFLVAAAAGLASGGDHPRHGSGCGPCGTAGGTVTPYGDTGCGRRYCGAKHDEPWTPDPCDSCNRWRGCNGAQALPEMLAPWQLPPCRGFRSAADVGYAGNGGGGPCLECWSPFYRLW